MVLEVNSVQIKNNEKIVPTVADRTNTPNYCHTLPAFWRLTSKRVPSLKLAEKGGLPLPGTPLTRSKAISAW